MQNQHGFSLIELLIVIAIILILIAIALPNFLDSQARAKMVRAMGDMRSLGLSLEMYQSDWRAYPPYGRIAPDDAIEYPATVNNFGDKMCFVGLSLTTPIPYIHGIPRDLFGDMLEGPDLIHQIEYINLDQHVANFPDPPPPFTVNLIPSWGHWRMVSAGPDGDRGADIKDNKVYTPTNGARSDGDIVRTQRYEESMPARPFK